ncbi:MAG: ribonuclease HI family protein [Acidobacteriota bacterium]|nr:ribonuclease HI family protein [Acidobacteriota bacterium]
MAGRFRAAFDGGSRGNPGAAAWGVAVIDADGQYVEGHAGVLGHATNNVAEYHGLLEALRLAVERGADDVEVQADSELIVRQIQGSYRVRQPHLKPLHEEAARLIACFRRFRIKHVRRAENREADRLVNLALDRAEAGESEAARIVDHPGSA